MKMELLSLLRRIASELPSLKESLPELHNAHTNLRNIRRSLARPDFRPRKCAAASWSNGL